MELIIAIVDYGAGNLFSVKNAFDYIGLNCLITGDIREIERADSVVLPGVGAFGCAMEMLLQNNLVDIIKASAQKKPLLGICLGMQMLFEYSTEMGKTAGLGLIDGYVDRIVTTQKIPHIGFNQLEFNKPSPLLANVAERDCVYFVHSFMANTCSQNVAAYSDYNAKIPALVQVGNVFGAQFHPEKSGNVGLQMLINFGGLT